MKKARWLWIVVVALVVVGGGGYWIYRRKAPSQGMALAAGAGQEVAVVERGTLRINVEGSGSLEPQSEVAISFESSGKVIAVLVEEGDRVQAGDALVQLEDTDARQSVTEAELQVRQSEAGLKSAQLKLDDLLTWAPDAGAVELAQANLDAAQASYDRIIAGNTHQGAQLVSVKVRLDQAQRALDDAQAAYDSAYDPGREWELNDPRRSDRMETERENATNALQQAKENLAVAQANYTLQAVTLGDSDVRSAWSKVVNARVALENEQTPPDASDIAAARIQVKQAEITLAQSRLRLEAAQETLADLTLAAPVEGVVTTLNAEVGQMMSASQTAAVLADLSALSVEIGLDESDIVQVAVGQPAVVTLDAFDESELHGAITYIAPTAQAQSGVVLYDVTVALDPTTLPVRAGMTADVEIATESADDALIIPLKAVRSVDGKNFVVRQLRDGEPAPAGATNVTQGFTMAPVTLGLMTDTQVVVLDGLREGDVVEVTALEATRADDASGMPFRPGLGRLMQQQP
ncbi:MAG: efflux RND transporter periplasmic adaptor subunit [Anaerolineae bacterium]|nr:efflux RND transporter periplasmic adaptor subunit [Anaerolineae bacterium]